MTELEQLWRRKTDHDLLSAAARLHEYSERAQQVINAELERRRSPEYLRSLESAAVVAPETVTAHRGSELPPAYTNSPIWLLQRALLAVGLMIGFYLFAMTIALVLLWIPYAEWVYVSRIHIKVAAVCIGAGLTILWSLVPRVDRFTDPGPRLEESKHPHIFAIITAVARATKQEPPSDVYLLNEINAWVTHRGGVMGFGSRRIMGIGLPLLQAVTVGEFEAIIAHEFGHYSAGDVALGPWIYKTRAAIARTIAGVHTTFIEAPFRWYARNFLLLTHAVSRRQEFVADRVAATVAGAAVVGDALKRVSVVTQLYSSYLSQEVLPVLNAGFVPPISAGFDEFLKSEQANPFDTHPTLQDRLRALDTAPKRNEATLKTEPASTLISDHEAYARTAGICRGRRSGS